MELDDEEEEEGDDDGVDKETLKEEFRKAMHQVHT